jgi:hypothetical protein
MERTYLSIDEKEVEELQDMGIEMSTRSLSPYYVRLYGERLLNLSDRILLREAGDADSGEVPARMTLPPSPDENLELFPEGKDDP